MTEVNYNDGEWPEIVIVMLTWSGPPELDIANTRLEYTKKTIAGIKKHFIYPNYTWHIADDNSTPWYQDEIKKLMEGETYTFSDTKKGWDMNNNWNTGMKVAFERADIIAGWPDDRFLDKDFDVKSYVRLLMSYEDICYIRLSGGEPRLKETILSRVGREWRLLGKDSTARHVYLAFNFMLHKRWIDYYGYFEDNLWPLDIAEDTVDSHFRKTAGPGIVIPVDIGLTMMPWGTRSTWEKPQGGTFRKEPPPLDERVSMEAGNG